MSDNFVSMKVKALSRNEGLIRGIVAAFCVELEPTLEEISDIKTAVSEAATNSIVHAYSKNENGIIDVEVEIQDNTVNITVSDTGIGINNIEEALQPFYTTKPKEERSGMGFTVMQAFMDEVTVQNNTPHGLIVKMTKIIHGQ